MQIERATPADASVIAPLFAAYRKFYERPADPQAERGYLSARLDRTESVIFVAFAGERAAGFAQLFPLFSSLRLAPVWLLSDLFVAPKARGSGIATALLERCRAFAAETGACGIELSTAVTNATAQRVYERAGYRREDGFYTYFRDLEEDRGRSTL